jgi:hypothetical protein
MRNRPSKICVSCGYALNHSVYCYNVSCTDYSGPLEPHGTLRQMVERQQYHDQELAAQLNESNVVPGRKYPHFEVS